MLPPDHWGLVGRVAVRQKARPVCQPWAGLATPVGTDFVVKIAKISLEPEKKFVKIRIFFSYEALKSPKKHNRNTKPKDLKITEQ